MPQQSQTYQHPVLRRGKRPLIGATALLLVALCLQVLVPRLMPSASAGSSFLCVGFSDCSRKGYSASGYHQHWGHMYWRMYSGRNCVNYAAYRMVERGMPDVRPWSGSGNATNWGRAMSSITDKTPVVGSIAWWKGGAPGASSLGHVAYVEKVVSRSEILVSESNYGSDFDWRRITTSANWPTGFIHFKDAGITNLKKPTVTGTPKVGETLAVRGGKWKPVSNPSFQWLADGKVIRNQTHRTITPTKGLLGKHLSVRVTASLEHYQSTSVTTAATAPVAKGDLKVVNPPKITGTPQVGSQLRVGSATFDPAAHAGEIRWYADGQLIKGETTRVLDVGEELAGKQITATVVGARAGRNSLATTSAAVGPVVWPPVTQASSGGVSGSPAYGHTLTVSPGTFEPAGTTVSYQWLRGSTPIPGATHASYRTTAADLGKSIRVRVRAEHAKYRDLVKTYAVNGRVQAKPTVRVKGRGLRGAERIRVRVGAPGAYIPTGRVAIMTYSRTKTVRLVKGVAVVRFDHIPAGRRRIKVTYLGDRALLERVARAQTHVHRR